jgi:hypothetical protein
VSSPEPPESAGSFWDAFADRLGTDEMQDAINQRGDQVRAEQEKK